MSDRNYYTVVILTKESDMQEVAKTIESTGSIEVVDVLPDCVISEIDLDQALLDIGR